LEGREPILHAHPLPYAALTWIVAHTPPEVFLGNPRVHYQHLADRVREPRRAQRSTRAWAAWWLVRLVRPALPPDPGHLVREPSHSEVAFALQTHGVPGERQIWEQACRLADTLSGSAPLLSH